jgi:hypothetical protein
MASRIRWGTLAGIIGLFSLLTAAPTHADPAGGGKLVNITLSAATALSTDNVWAVGGGADPHDPDNSDPAVEHWDGARWTQVPAERILENEEGLLDVSAVGPNDIWAVGSQGQPSFNDKQIEIEHWDGSAWSFVPPVQASFNDILSGVAAVASDDVWAVGALSTGGTGRNRALVEHWDGSTWSVVNIPDPPGTDSLSKVDAVSASDVWAIGTRGTLFGLTQPLTMHWNGSRWSLVKAPTVSGKTTILTDVDALASNDAWAVGSSFNASIPSLSNTLTEHWDGTRWTIVASADTGKDNADGLATVSAIAPNDVWAIGNFVDNGEKTLTEHWDGTRWSIVSAPDTFSMSGSAAVSSDDVWAVGSQIFDSRILHWDGSAWSLVPSP